MDLSRADLLTQFRHLHSRDVARDASQRSRALGRFYCKRQQFQPRTRVPHCASRSSRSNSLLLHSNTRRRLFHGIGPARSQMRSWRRVSTPRSLRPHFAEQDAGTQSCLSFAALRRQARAVHPLLCHRRRSGVAAPRVVSALGGLTKTSDASILGGSSRRCVSDHGLSSWRSTAVHGAHWALLLCPLASCRALQRHRWIPAWRALSASRSARIFPHRGAAWSQVQRGRDSLSRRCPRCHLWRGRRLRSKISASCISQGSLLDRTMAPQTNPNCSVGGVRVRGAQRYKRWFGRAV
mmetsp:Transcript_785/g.2131  ORF Transcript_785/g.2131 Transcript_785/m.2131 type:complete len:294 (+) Transcript_785:472-1353(+)